MKVLNPRQALNKAYLKQKPHRDEIEKLKKHLKTLHDRMDENESEEFHKNLLADFLKKTYYEPEYFINTKGRSDLVIHNGKNAKSPVGVMIEAKKPGNKNEMPSIKNINTKAVQELALYFLRERILNKNDQIRNLIATNVYEWFVFDARIFENIFAKNKNFVEKFKQFEAKRLSSTDTSYFYNEIAAPFIDAHIEEFEVCHFDLRDYKGDELFDKSEKDNRFIPLYKILSPEHMLKLPFANDSNSLDKGFYEELLHIIGLTEVKKSGKKLIQRQKKGQRNSGSLLEDAIMEIDSLDMIYRMPDAAQYGDSKEERLFGIGLELIITWINRILFLKLLEGQLLNYHDGDEEYSFLNLKKIHNFDDLNTLFFKVLAKKEDQRHPEIKKAFDKVPYLNSSLFEPTETEHNTIFISNLRDELQIPLYKSTVLKNQSGKRLTGEMYTLDYLFKFLNAYDFSSEGSEDIQEENKSLINASVLGLIFEKINGYKEGSFFTPGFITMYMARETVRRAVMQKFNDNYGWECENITQLYNKLDRITEEEANNIINSLTVCDPAVGSGHFLVSVLNEIIALKAELGALMDKDGRKMRDYDIVVENDELIITDYNGEIYEYKPNSKESQRVQETLFHEKQTIIENCLFGVDINPNSVKICRLRLWIELLKNAYYRDDGYLETLPNIDINIKCGNSLISRFALGSDLRPALRSSKWSIESYLIAVQSYRDAENSRQRHEMQKLINDIKGDFTKEIISTDPRKQRLSKLVGEELKLTAQTNMFEESEKEKKEREKKIAKLQKQIAKLQNEIEEEESGKIYQNAFEWRFEFPEVLDPKDGSFIGFDIVIGNPPYGVKLETKEKILFKEIYNKVHIRTPDTFNYFIANSSDLMGANGFNSFITPNNLLFQNEYEKTRKLLLLDLKLLIVVNLGDGVFDDASVPTSIYLVKNSTLNNYQLEYADFRYWHKDESNLFLKDKYTKMSNREILQMPAHIFGILKKGMSIIEKIKNKSEKLGKVADRIGCGISTGGDKIFRLQEQKVLDLNLERELCEKVLVGSDINRYSINDRKFKILYMTKTIDIEKFPNVKKYLAPYEDQLSKKRETKKGLIPYWCLHWPRNRDLFKPNKIIVRQTSDNVTAAIDEKDYYALDSIIIIRAEKINNRFLLAILNSKITQFVYSAFTQEAGRTFPQVKPKNLKKLYIPIIPEPEQQPFINLVTQILTAKSSDPKADTSALEHEIDQLVYDLYGLTDDEIAVIEGDG
ncbi:MAG: Eco57I restriction-modification methylase domain-containing protein [Candidatus Zixiibacteriota bacterium]